ncbi:MAG TPA: [Fe-Fe] hydrogenase large subunit C-terminal domain-containing protein [Bacillota bacterium]|nr:[Fe-Fe] hydrogenase large subunit C-terminal domain-containing protein [Bacillota bacterium]
MNKLHSVSLNKDLCVGCTNCIKGCPTQAIRVRDGKAAIYDIRCIDCSECIRICPYHAKIPVTDSLQEKLAGASGKIKVAIVSPALFTQFENHTTRLEVLKAVKLLGFDYVYDESIGYSGYLSATKQMIHEKIELCKSLSEDEQKDIFPLISSSCPVVVRLIQMKYRTLISHLISIDSPMEMTARYAIDELTELLQIKENLLSLCYITPCPARKTSVVNPLWKKKSLFSFCVGIHDVYPKLRGLLEKGNLADSINDADKRVLRISDNKGLLCTSVGGESVAIDIDNFLTVDGISNVTAILDEIENDHLSNIEYVEPSCCFSGCVGGPLTVMNRFAAQAMLRELIHETIMERGLYPDLIVHEESVYPQSWELPLAENHAMRLSDNIGIAMSKYEQIDSILATLPQIDCGACGAPSCAAMAEDIVQGRASIENCMIMHQMAHNDKASKE